MDEEKDAREGYPYSSNDICPSCKRALDICDCDEHPACEEDTK